MGALVIHEDLSCEKLVGVPRQHTDVLPDLFSHFNTTPMQNGQNCLPYQYHDPCCA